MENSVNTYNVEFSICYTNANVLKKKKCDILTSSIGTSRLAYFMTFENYGMINFSDEDTKHVNPEIIVQDKFNRLKTNCLIYNLKETPHNPNIYNKLVIYYEVCGKNGYYNYLLFNTETGKNVHITWIEDLVDMLLHRLNMTFNTMLKRKLFEYYSQQYDASKVNSTKFYLGKEKLQGKNIPYPTVTDYEKLMEYYDKLFY